MKPLALTLLSSVLPAQQGEPADPAKPLGGLASTFAQAGMPQLSVMGDFAVSVSNQRDRFEDVDRFRLRDLELGATGEIDPTLSYFAFIHFAEDEMELEEAFARSEGWLPGGLILRGGRFNSDFGRLSPQHDEDLPFLDKPQVLQEYVGGSLRGTGAELGGWLTGGPADFGHDHEGHGDAGHNHGSGDPGHLHGTGLRWSFSAINGLDSDSHAIFGPASDHEHGEEEGPEAFGGRSFENFSFVGRTAYENDATPGQHVQVGVSAAYAPEAVQFVDGMAGSTERVDTNVAIFGLDAAYQWRDPSTRAGYSVGAEFLHIRNEFVPEGLTSVASANATGFYVYGEHFLDRTWSVGTSGGWFEHAEDDADSSWDVGVFSTWQVNDNNRLRIEARRFDDPNQDSWGLTVQWTVFLGPHNHGTPGIWH